MEGSPVINRRYSRLTIGATLFLWRRRAGITRIQDNLPASVPLPFPYGDVFAVVRLGVRLGVGGAEFVGAPSVTEVSALGDFGCHGRPCQDSLGSRFDMRLNRVRPLERTLACFEDDAVLGHEFVECLGRSALDRGLTEGRVRL